MGRQQWVWRAVDGLTVSSDRKEKFLGLWVCGKEAWVWLGQRSVEFFEEGTGADDTGTLGWGQGVAYTQGPGRKSG